MRSRALLVVCAVAVAFAAVDTYVVVLALPDMMASTGIPVDELQRAAPIVSGFLLGYVAMLPLIGRIADLRGPVPVLGASLATFALGSLLTAASYDLTTMVLGRFLQGVGGGGLVPATMALVAARYPVAERGLPLGLVSAVQELGSVLGPLLGAVVLAVATWRGIFALNLVVGLVLAAVLVALGRSSAGTTDPDPPPRRLPDPVGLLLLLAVRATAGRPDRPDRRGLPDLLGLAALAVLLVAVTLVLVRPGAVLRDLTWGQLYIPYVAGGGRWLTPLGLTAAIAAVVLVARLGFARRPLVDVRGWGRSLREADLLGAVLLAVALGGVVLAFATADPEQAVLSPAAPWYLAGSAVALVLLVVHLRRAEAPLVPRGALRARPAWGSLVVSLLVGWALIAALVDIPLYARTTTESTQLGAALVLLRFLVALPVGAVLGGWACRRLPAAGVAAVGMACAAAGFWVMSGWGATSLESPAATVPLVLAGLGFGLALAPVNAAVLASTLAESHGVASAMVVVARMVGMLVGISALTSWGLSRLYAARAEDPSLGVRELAVLQEQAVFAGAALTALLAAVLALLLLRGAPTREVSPAQVLRSVG